MGKDPRHLVLQVPTIYGSVQSHLWMPTFCLATFTEYHKDTCDTSLTCSVADKGDKFLWSAANMGVSPLMLPVNQEMAEEESKQGEASLQAEPKDLNMDTHLQLQGFSEVSCLLSAG